MTQPYTRDHQRADIDFLVGVNYGRELSRAKLAAVRALADEWERKARVVDRRRNADYMRNWLGAAHQLRAVLDGAA